MSKNILLIGNGNHQFINNLSWWLKCSNTNYQIDILSILPVEKDKKEFYHSVYIIYNIVLFYRVINKIKWLHRICRFIKYRKLIRRLPKYDIINFHFIEEEFYSLTRMLKKNTTSKIIYSIWGSDMYCLKAEDTKHFINSCELVDYITFTNRKSLEHFCKNFNWKKDNLNLALFGSNALEELKKLEVTKDKCKDLLGWNKDKLAITIGYNLSSAQQHLKILEYFDREELKILKNRIELIFPITYGGNKKYKHQLLNRINSLPYRTWVYDSFLDDRNIALIRNASDIMIQLQPTDQLSGSMQEYLYTRNVVITGSWLPYAVLKEKGAWFIEIDEFMELLIVLPELINNYSLFVDKTEKCRNAITELFSWNNNIHSWINLYNL